MLQWKLLTFGMAMALSVKAMPMHTKPELENRWKWSHVSFMLNLPLRTQKSFPAPNNSGYPLFVSAHCLLPINNLGPSYLSFFVYSLEVGAEYGAWLGSHPKAAKQPFVLSFPVEISVSAMLALYVKAGAGFDLFFDFKKDAAGYRTRFGVHPTFKLGIMLPFWKALDPRLEIGYPHLLSIGLVFFPLGDPLAAQRLEADKTTDSAAEEVADETHSL